MFDYIVKKARLEESEVWPLITPLSQSSPTDLNSRHDTSSDSSCKLLPTSTRWDLHTGT